MTGGYEFENFTGGDKGITKTKVHHDPLKGDQVVLKLTHSGICGTDAHFMDAGICLGHEVRNSAAAERSDI